ncbi:MAG: DUF1343 domain-containing protein [Bacteroidota bacterium]
MAAAINDPPGLVPVVNRHSFARHFYPVIFMLWPLLVQSQVIPGAGDTAAYFPILKGRSIGIVANNASVVWHANIVDVLIGKGFYIKRIFSPEHGFRMNSDAGQTISDTTDPATGIRVVSLYGSKQKPAREDLASLDMMVFDLQDVGVRFYTYISTLTFVMEACAENGIPLVLLDRPNPNGFYIDGPVLEKEFASFVGMHPVPVVYGMTIGEYACMVNGEKWLKNGRECDLKVIRLTNYTHETKVELEVKPSPNLPDANAVWLYPSLCLFEGTTFSIGRGTNFPFEVFGHPLMKSGSFSFTPRSVPGASLHPPFENRECHGVDLRGYLVKHPEKLGMMQLGWLLEGFHSLAPDGFFNDYFNKLAGNATLQRQIREGKSETEIRASWQKGISRFKAIRKRYLMY